MIAPVIRDAYVTGIDSRGTARVMPVEPVLPAYLSVFREPRSKLFVSPDKRVRTGDGAPVVILVNAYTPEGKVLIPESIGESVDVRA